MATFRDNLGFGLNHMEKDFTLGEMRRTLPSWIRCGSAGSVDISRGITQEGMPWRQLGFINSEEYLSQFQRLPRDWVASGPLFRLCGESSLF